MTEATPAPIAAPTASSTRDRLLDAAADLFYREGMHIGVEALCRAAGVSKRSMYQLFDSKDEVIAASLDRTAAAYRAALFPAADDAGSPRERILHVFRRLEALSVDADFHGCPFVAAAVELKVPEHPGSLAARRHKNALIAYFRHEAEAGGAQDPAELSRHLTVVFDGANSWGVVQGSGTDGLAISMATTLLDAAGMKDTAG
ncbi:TetR family transcriptional regulator [Streptomyces tateyamensis]|uniref:TetR family transcriptional regulator n=1 Tax=Streptomyces tateyamensis TaxID=565073 RepID=A0A2V4N0S8_9ACTN|nr:TetR/AcrR family transcriptional regulator [Streptomyces tateyamensis]PYC74483.1 TetR family transcriptional regulator [Streptomyces tateyamensis]